MKIKYLGAFLLLSLAVFSLPHLSHAQSSTSTQMLTGYAWSDNIGWVSFNCDNAGTCLNSDKYKVEIMSDGTLSGYAWSDNIGWIEFGNGVSSGSPSGSGTGGAAKLSGSGIIGWARALSAGTDGGWDGWLSFSGNTVTSPVNYHNSPITVGSVTPATVGTQGSYGVTVSGNNLSSYAWGSDVIGWLSFSGPGYGVTIEPNDSTTDTGTGTGTSSSDCVGPDGTPIPNGTSKTYFQSPSVASGLTCVGESRMCNNGVLSGSYTNPSCTVASAAGFTAGVAPKVTLAIASHGGSFSHGPLIINSGVKIDLKWSFAASGGAPDACVGSASLAASNPLPVTISVSTPTLLQNLSVAASATYTISCSNSFGTSSDSVKTIVFAVKEF